jgi:carbonic anhydrase
MITSSTKEKQAAMTPDMALDELKAGNERFLLGKSLNRDYLAEIKATSDAQYPFAVVLNCLDSRQPVEIILDQGIGNIFNARMAGNVLCEGILGSMEFACKIAGAKLIAVIGHYSCGAIKGAIDDVKLGYLTDLVSKIKPAIDAVPNDIQPRTSKNRDFMNKVSEANVHLIMQQIPERSEVLRQMINDGQIKLAGGMYNHSTGQVHFF